MNLGEREWQINFEQTLLRDSEGWHAEPIYIPTALTTPIIRVYCFSESARSSWRVAGELVQIIGESRNPDFEGDSISLPLNVKKLVEFSPTVSDYSLKLFPKPWINSFELKIESLAS
jgi:hypothetical protein